MANGVPHPTTCIVAPVAVGTPKYRATAYQGTFATQKPEDLRSAVSEWAEFLDRKRRRQR